jgi:hypothetical protein
VLSAIYLCKLRLAMKNQSDSQVASSTRNMSQRNLAFVDIKSVKILIQTDSD